MPLYSEDSNNIVLYLAYMLRFLRPPPDATIPFLVLISFLIWFSISRLFVYTFPGVHLTLGNIHIHHYTYGIILLSVLSFVFLAYPMSHHSRLRLAIPLGIALAFAYDEYAMWLTLGGPYFGRRTYDAIVFIALVLLNLTYLPHFWARWGRRLEKLLNILFLGFPRLIYRTIRRLFIKHPHH